MSDELPTEAERLLGVAPEEFVAERARVARELRETGRFEDAATVAALRKPPPVVFAVNRAARARPKAARAAADAALRVKRTQLAGDPVAYGKALAELEESLALLSDVALAQAAPAGREPTDATRRRLRDLLRNAVADDEAREALARGALAYEVETTGFASFAGISPAHTKRRRATASPTDTKSQDDRRRRRREQELRAELAEAEARLREAERSLGSAEREHTRAERAVESVRTKLDRL